MATREPIMTALLSACANAASFATVSRQIDFDPAMGPTPNSGLPPAQPALYLLEGDERHRHAGYGPTTKRTLDVMLMIWCRIPTGLTPGTPDGVSLGATALNTLIEAIEAVLQPDNFSTGAYTIGGLVQRCWIDGSVVKVTGDMNPDGQCFAAIPLSILIP